MAFLKIIISTILLGSIIFSTKGISQPADDSTYIIPFSGDAIVTDLTPQFRWLADSNCSISMEEIQTFETLGLHQLQSGPLTIHSGNCYWISVGIKPEVDVIDYTLYLRDSLDYQTNLPYVDVYLISQGHIHQSSTGSMVAAKKKGTRAIQVRSI